LGDENFTSVKELRVYFPRSLDNIIGDVLYHI
jgi:hypothetical protein